MGELSYPGGSAGILAGRRAGTRSGREASVIKEASVGGTDRKHCVGTSFVEGSRHSLGSSVRLPEFGVNPLLTV